ncbi:TPA: hypothetical protein U9I93_000501 [Acinetobacter baumannii]|nr:hypothetical protein [Acinetobacter baumannii]
MSVPEQTPFIEYTANGITTVFPLNYECKNQDELIVLKDGHEALVGSWQLSSNNVVFSEPPSINTKIIIERNTKLNRPTDYNTYDNSFRPDSVNAEFDRIIYMIQDIAARLIREIEGRQLSDSELIQFVKDYVESILSINNPEAITLVLADIVQTTIDGNTQTQQEFNEYILDYINIKYPSITEFIEQIQAAFDSFKNDTLAAVNSAIDAIPPAVDAAVANAGNMIGAANKAALDLITDKPVGQNAMLDNGDIYRWNGTAWVFTGLNYINASTENARKIEHNRQLNISKLTYEQTYFATLPTSTTGTTQLVVRDGIKQLKISSSTTGGALVAYWEFLPSMFPREFAFSICLEGLTSGSDGVVGIQQLDSNNTIISSSYAEGGTSMSGAITKKTYKALSTGIVPFAVKVRFIVDLRTTSTREVYIHSPFIADGNNAEFISPRNLRNENLLLSTFIRVIGKNQFNKAEAKDKMVVNYKTGVLGAFDNGIAFGKCAVSPGGTYTFWMPLDGSDMKFRRLIYTYDKAGVYLGMDVSAGVPPDSEFVNRIDPPTGVTYADGDKTVQFTIPDNSRIAFIQMMIVYVPHITTDFNNLVNGMQLELGEGRTAYEPYDPNAPERLYIKPSAILGETGGGSAVLPTGNTFTVLIDGTYALIRTPFSETLDLVQKVQYGTNDKWKNNVINPYEIKTIPKSTAKESLANAYSTGTLVVSHPDDAAPLRYNNTYIGANHGVDSVRQIIHNGHGKANVDVGSIYQVEGKNYTLIRVVDANNLWLFPDNVGTSSTKWLYPKDSLSGKTLTHVSGGTNTADIVVSTSSLADPVQLLPAVNNHVRKIIVDGYKTITASGFYDVESIEFVDTYNIVNPPSLISYLRAHTGTSTDPDFTVSSLDYDVNVQVSYKYAVNGSVTINSQYLRKSDINFEFAGLTQALPLNFTGKTLLQYVPKVKPIVGSLKTWDFANIEDITTTIERVDFLKANWVSANNPPDRMAQIVKNGANKEFGHVVGYSLERGATKPSIRQNTTDAGFIFTSRKMYPKALVGSLDSVVNTIAYRILFNPNLLPEATVYGWCLDNNDVLIMLDIHQSASMLKLPLGTMFNGKSATVSAPHANFTLHSEIVSDGGLLCSIVNGYACVTIKLS